jgi:hypothetical protein
MNRYLTARLLHNDGTTKDPFKRDAYNHQTLLTYAKKPKEQLNDKLFLKNLLLARACNQILEIEINNDELSSLKELLVQIEQESQEALNNM